MSKRPALSHQPAQAAEDTLGPDRQSAPTVQGFSGAEKRLWLLAFRRQERQQTRRAVRSTIRAAYWAHRSGLGPLPPIQAVRCPERYLSRFVWDEECDWWSCPGELRKSEQQAESERRWGDDEGMAA